MLIKLEIKNREDTISTNKEQRYQRYHEEEVLPFNQKRMIEQAKFTNSSIGKAFQKEIKTI